MVRVRREQCAPDGAYEEIKDYLTPYKLGRPVLAPSGEKGTFDCLGVDNMRIIRHNGKFYMFYIGFDGTDYRTARCITFTVPFVGRARLRSARNSAPNTDALPSRVRNRGDGKRSWNEEVRLNVVVENRMFQDFFEKKKIFWKKYLTSEKIGLQFIINEFTSWEVRRNVLLPSIFQNQRRFP